MCPECLSVDWTQQAENKFVCDKCGAVHTTSEMIFGSDYYVYRFVNDDWGVPFYVGKGSGYRYRTLSDRSKHIQNICSNNRWHPEIVRYCDSEESAYECEKLIKTEYKNLGYPIIDGETTIIHKERHREGIEVAKAAGKYKGKPPMEIDERQFRIVCKRWRAGEITAKQAMNEINLKPNTFYRRVNQWGL